MNGKSYPSRVADKVIIRVPKGMRDAIAAIAAAEHRSMNSQLVLVLERWLSERGSGQAA